MSKKHFHNAACLLYPLPPPLRRKPCRRADRLLRGGQHPESRPRGPALLGRALHQRHPGQRHGVFLRLHPQVLLLPELPHQRRGTGQRDHDRASGRNFPRSAEAGRPQHQPRHPPASGGPGSSRRWTLPGPRGCVCPSSATPAATRRWRAWRRGAAISTSGWPI